MVLTDLLVSLPRHQHSPSDPSLEITSSKAPASGPNLQPASCDIQQTESELKPKKKKKKKGKVSGGQEDKDIGFEAGGEAAVLMNEGDSLMTTVEQSAVEKKSKKKPKEKEPKEPKEPKTPKTPKTPKIPKEPKEKKVKTATPKPKSSKKPRLVKFQLSVEFTLLSKNLVLNCLII